MGKRSKKLRAQLYQYREDEAGSYNKITDWNPSPSTFGTNNSRHQSRISSIMNITKKQLLIVGLVGTACIIAIAAGIAIGVPLSGESVDRHHAAKFAAPLENIAQKPKTEGKFESSGGGRGEAFYTVPPPSPTELGEYEHAAVSSDGVPCGQIAKDILLRNGTAADATIAGLFCVGVINAQSMGLGGGFLLTYYDKASRKAYSLISRETAPEAAYEDMFEGDAELSVRGGLAVAVPGEIRGYYELYQRFGGKVPWADLIEPTIELCENGHLVNWHMARALKSYESDILNEPSMSVFVNPETGTVYKEGDTIKRLQLAKTLRALQQDPDALNTGELSYKLVEDIQSFDGVITHNDLKNYRPVWKEAVNVSLQNSGVTLYSVPPPGSGLILGFILNILDEYGLTEESVNDDNRVLTHHRITEAMKWAYAKRTELGDADFVDMSGLAKNLTSDFYAESIRNQIIDDRTFQDPGHYGAVTAIDDDHGTAHFSLIAPNGDAVSVTSTINLYFGAGIRSVQTGIVLNDEMDDFSAPNITNFFGIPPSPANFIRPGKRPLSSMCPAVFVDSQGNARLIIGAAGGTKISSAVAWATLRNLWLGNNIKEAIDARRIHHQLYPMSFSYENGILKDIVDGLEKLGHVTQEFGVGGSVVCGIARGSNGLIYANSDFRKAGEVQGF